MPVKYEVKPEVQEALDEAPPPGSEQLRLALNDFLASRGQNELVFRLLALLNPDNLAVGAKKYAKPEWRDDAGPSLYRSHWRHQACLQIGCKEEELPEAVVVALRGFLWPGALGTQQAERLVWLVKVPTFVSRVWKQQAAAAVTAIEEDGKEQNDDTLGKMRIAIDPFAPPEKKQRFTFDVTPDIGASARIPTSYDMYVTPDSLPMHVFSDVRAAAPLTGVAAAAAGAAAKQKQQQQQEQDGMGEFQLEGCVAEKFDMRPCDANDAAYNELSRNRMNEAQKKTRITQVVTEAARMAPLPKARNLLKGVGAKKDEPRRERMERPLLENALFSLYEKRGVWRLKDLIAETRQPADYVKEVLNEIAVLNRRGPNAGQWSLKDIYKRKPKAEGGA